jgi:hypothetical protein
MNPQVRDFLQFILSSRKPSHLQIWAHLLTTEKDGQSELPFYEVQGRFGISRPTLYRILEDGKAYGIESKSRKKVLVVEFPNSWFAVDEPQNKITQLAISTPSNRELKAAAKKQCHTACMKVYSEWYSERNAVNPKIQAADAAGLKQIVNYLFKAVEAKTPDLNESEIADRVVKSWALILSKWESLTPFLQSQVKLSQINSNLTNILNGIKNPKPSQASSRSSRFAATENELNSGSNHNG